MMRQKQEKDRKAHLNKKAKTAKTAKTTVKKTGRALGIRVQVVIYFTAFVIVILGILWVFQIGLLDFFYERTRLSEFDDAAEEIISSINANNLEETCYNAAIRYGVCIRVYRCNDLSATKQIASVEVNPTCLIHHITADTIDQYYRNAVENDGKWIKKIELYSSRNPMERKKDVNEIERPQVTTPREMAVTVRSYTDAASNDYAIFINAEFTPMNSTVDTLNVQFRWISKIFVLAAALLSYIFSARISEPLVRMNTSAKNLAAGNYNTEFREEGYRETRELAETLNYAASEIARSDEVKKELIANISHDLRTPLTMISGYAEIIRDIPCERTPENVQIIIDESNRLTALVNDMLDLSKVQAGTADPQYTVFDLTDTIGEVMQRYSALVAHHGYTINFNADRGVKVRADRTMMLQVVYNLINNAVNYAGEDKIVEVTETVLDGKVRVTVMDRGEGIPPEQIKSIWERYYKVDRVHRRARVGTGLGLSIVRNILQLHKASFGVESAVGQGTSFWFELDEVEVTDEDGGGDETGDIPTFSDKL